MKTPISIRTAVPRVATARKASVGDGSMARLAVLRSPETQRSKYRLNQSSLYKIDHPPEREWVILIVARFWAGMLTVNVAYSVDGKIPWNALA